MRLYLFLFLFLLSLTGVTQVTTSPALPADNKALIITFDASQGTAGLKDFTGDVYTHTGVITDKSTSASDWKYVIGSWGNNTSQPKLTRSAPNTYTLNISPDVRSFYGVPAGETIKQLKGLVQGVQIVTLGWEHRLPSILDYAGL